MKFSSTTVTVTFFALIGVIIVVYGAVALHGDPANYVSFVGPIITVLLSLVLVSGKVDKIEKQTNGQLTQQFDNLAQHVTEQTHAAADSAIETIKEGNAP